ncbi:hypothetical protein [Thermoclostridium caenicola]|uniref:Uncharacterized protein n=1 Tax=Thermoclostridium caenicola TaxID=659425 RepID=A0A1M6KXV9_9FIRM|nr:hypothetical protein [Thermoclostridium caenicola]SHJ63749.1 hypothetical protein SAMN05444373_11071 [Thermoclostridium caenicola]
MKKLRLFALVLFILSLLISQVYANPPYKNVVIDPIIVKPEVYEVCSGKPYHDMKSRGIALVSYNDSWLLIGSPCWQCKNCYLVLATEGDPTYPYYEPIGTWAYKIYDEPINIYGACFDADYVGYCPDNRMDGYRFSY